MKMPGIVTRQALWALLLCGAWHSAGAASTGKTPIDEALRHRLAVAMADEGSVANRFDAEVWLTDMSTRLARTIPDQSKRLRLLKNIYFEAHRAKLEPQLVLAVIQVESNFNRFAISESGAQGLMQVMPFWLKRIGHPKDNLFNIRTNLRMGCTILRYYMDKERNNMTRALARYNGSIGSYKYPQRVFDVLRTRWFR